MSYYSENRLKVLEKKKQYQIDKVSQIKEYQRSYYILNKESKKAKVKARYSIKKIDIIAKNIANKRTRRAIDPFFKMSHNVRSLISGVLALRHFSKKSKTSKMLNCSFEFFNGHIEDQFDLGMTWDNYGSVWTYDHICPCSQALNEEELIALQHYSNFRPYRDNLIKSDSKTPEGERLCLELLKRQWL